MQHSQSRKRRLSLARPEGKENDAPAPPYGKAPPASPASEEQSAGSSLSQHGLHGSCGAFEGGGEVEDGGSEPCPAQETCALAEDDQSEAPHSHQEDSEGSGSDIDEPEGPSADDLEGLATQWPPPDAEGASSCSGVDALLELMSQEACHAEDHPSDREEDESEVTGVVVLEEDESGNACEAPEHSEGDDGLAALGAALPCVSCGCDLADLPVSQRDAHANACLDKREQEQRLPTGCAICGAGLDRISEAARHIHVNACLDASVRDARRKQGAGKAAAASLNSAKAAESAPAAAAPLGDAAEHESASDMSGAFFVCRFCDRNLSALGPVQRVRHFKRCAATLGLTGAAAIAAVAATSNDQPEPQSGLSQSSITPPEALQVAAGDSSGGGSSALTRALPLERQGTMRDFFPRVAVQRLASDVLMKAQRAAQRQQTATAAAAAASGAGRGGSGGGSGTRGLWRRGPRLQGSALAASCPAFKKIPGTRPPIVVDGFCWACPELSNVYILTHFHADHTVGLTGAFSAGVIYCTAPTAALVRKRIGVAAHLLKPLPLLVPSPVKVGSSTVTITLLDANHCPGAAMALLDLPNGRLVLHVGDFRWDRQAMLSASPPLRLLTAAGGPEARRLDSLYLDTTYAHPKHAFPSQRVAIDALVSAVAAALKLPELPLPDDDAGHIGPWPVPLPTAASAAGGAFGAARGSEARSGGTLQVQDAPRKRKPQAGTLVLFGAYSLGKERLYLEVAARLGLKVWVDRRRSQTLSLAGIPRASAALLTTDPKETPLWVVPIGHVNFQKMRSYLDPDPQQGRLTGGATRGGGGGGGGAGWRRVMGVQPTGWSFGGRGGGGSGGSGRSLLTRRESGAMVLLGVPYSEHSSFGELRDCLEFLSPRHVVPTVDCGSVAKVQMQLRTLSTGVAP